MRQMDGRTDGRYIDQICNPLSFIPVKRPIMQKGGWSEGGMGLRGGKAGRSYARDGEEEKEAVPGNHWAGVTGVGPEVGEGVDLLGNSTRLHPW